MGQPTETRRCREGDLTPQLDREIIELQHSAFTRTAAFATQRWYGTPLADDDLWITIRRDGRLAASLRIVHRTISAAGEELRMAGVANVCSRPDLRGQGFGKAVMLDAQDYLAANGQSDFGVLFCAPATAPFYARLGWREIHNDLIFVDSKTGCETRAASTVAGLTMIYPGRRRLDQWPTADLNLRGPLW